MWMLCEDEIEKGGYAMRDQWESTFVALDRLMAEMDAEAQGMVPEQRSTAGR